MNLMKSFRGLTNPRLGTITLTGRFLNMHPKENTELKCKLMGT